MLKFFFAKFNAYACSFGMVCWKIRFFHKIHHTPQMFLLFLFSFVYMLRLFKRLRIYFHCYFAINFTFLHFFFVFVCFVLVSKSIFSRCLYVSNLLFCYFCRFFVLLQQNWSFTTFLTNHYTDFTFSFSQNENRNLKKKPRKTNKKKK